MFQSITIIFQFVSEHLCNLIIFETKLLLQLKKTFNTSNKPSVISKYLIVRTVIIMAQDHHFSQGTFNNSQYNDSVKQISLYGGQTSNVNDSDSEDDIQIRMYHQMLMENYSQDAKSQAYSQIQKNQDQNFQDDQTQKQSIKSLKSVKSVKSLYSSRSDNKFNDHQSIKSAQTLRTMNSGGTMIPRDNNRDKRKYMKQEARRIKRELKDQQLREKRQKRQFKDLDIDIDGKRRGKNSSKNKRRRLTKKTLELLAKKFDEYYACENNSDYRGPKMNIREIGQLFDMGNSTIHKLYTEWMEDPSFYERINRQNLKQKAPQRKVTLERLQHVARLIKQNPFLTQNELTVELNKIEDLKYIKNGERIQITRTTVARLLKVGKFKKKRVKCVPKQRNTTKSLEKRFDYCTKYKDIWMKQAKIYFLDQSGFNLYMTRDKAWARPNEEITVNCPISKGKRFSLIAIIAQDGLTHWRIIQGTYRKYEYLDFIKQLFLRLREQMDQLTEEQRNEEQNMRQKWLILDNCAIHDKEQTVNLGKQCGMQILYLPPYSPQLNPIENWFHQVKAKIRKINYSGQKQLLEIMHRTLKQYENHDFTNYYRGCLKHVEKGIGREKF